MTEWNTLHSQTRTFADQRIYKSQCGHIEDYEDGVIAADSTRPSPAS